MAMLHFKFFAWGSCLNNETANPQPINSVEIVEPAVDQLFIEVYEQLHQAAHRMRVSQRTDTLNTTLLVHELYLRMKKSGENRYEAMPQFFAYAARAMRSIMIDHARSKIAERERIANVAVLAAIDEQSAALNPYQALALDAALKQLEQEDARAAKVVELHFFAGLSLLEISQQLALNVRTIDRDWRYARAFLHAAIGEF